MNKFRVTERYDSIGNALTEAEIESNARDEKIIAFQVMTVGAFPPEQLYYVVYCVEMNLAYMTPNQTSLMVDVMHARRKELLGEDYTERLIHE